MNEFIRLYVYFVRALAFDLFSFTKTISTEEKFEALFSSYPEFPPISGMKEPTEPVLSVLSLSFSLEQCFAWFTTKPRLHRDRPWLAFDFYKSGSSEFNQS